MAVRLCVWVIYIVSLSDQNTSLLGFLSAKATKCTFVAKRPTSAYSRTDFSALRRANFVTIAVPTHTLNERTNAWRFRLSLLSERPKGKPRADDTVVVIVVAGGATLLLLVTLVAVGCVVCCHRAASGKGKSSSSSTKSAYAMRDTAQQQQQQKNNNSNNNGPTTNGGNRINDYDTVPPRNTYDVVRADRYQRTIPIGKETKNV
jgi:hypothetical protein